MLEFRSDTLIQWARIIFKNWRYLNNLIQNVHTVFVICILFILSLYPCIEYILFYYVIRLPLYNRIHFSCGFNSLFPFNNICIAFISSLFVSFLTHQIINSPRCECSILYYVFPVFQKFIFVNLDFIFHMLLP